jgi:hypothetical protein
LQQYLAERLHCDPKCAYNKFLRYGKVNTFSPCERTSDVVAATELAVTEIEELERAFSASIEDDAASTRPNSPSISAIETGECDGDGEAVAEKGVVGPDITEIPEEFSSPTIASLVPTLIGAYCLDAPRAVEMAVLGEGELAQINVRNEQAHLSTLAAPAAAPAAAAATAALRTIPTLAASAPVILCLPSCPCAGGGQCDSGRGGEGVGVAGVMAASPASPFPAFALHAPLYPPLAQGAASPGEVLILGGVAVSGLPLPPSGGNLKKRPRCDHGSEPAKRAFEFEFAPRSCTNCKKWGGAECTFAVSCQGKMPRRACENYTSEGQQL